MDWLDIHNALGGDQQYQEIEDVCHGISSDRSIRAVVWTESGKAFCASGDIKKMRDRALDPALEPIEDRYHYLRTRGQGCRRRGAAAGGHGLAERIAKNPLHALRMAKRPLPEAGHARLETVLELSGAFRALAHSTSDHKRRIDAAVSRLNVKA